jgi:hypothetical protein
MKTFILALLCLYSSPLLAQEAPCIGYEKAFLESNYLSDYEVVTKDYRQGYVIAPMAYCLYWNANGTFRDKNIMLEFNEKDICVKATNGCVYDDLKLLISYMDEHFSRIDNLHWKTVDNRFLYTMVISPGSNQVEIETIAMPKPVVKKK